MTSATIPNTVTSIGTWAFGFTSLTTIAIPDSVTSIGNYAFDSTSLNSITFGANSQLTTIGTWAFHQTALTTIAIPDTVNTIGEYAFYKTTSLASITIPNWVTIGSKSFIDISTNPTVYVVDVSPVTFDEFKDIFNASTNRDDTITYVEYDPLYYFNDTAIQWNNTLDENNDNVELFKSNYPDDTNDDFILRCKEDLQNDIEKVAFVLKWTDNDRTTIESAPFKSSINNTYYKPTTTKGQQIYVLEDNKDSVNTILVADENWPSENGPILYG